MTSLLRYPGGKKKLLKVILHSIDPYLRSSDRYIEPFLGGGSVALGVLRHYPSIKEVVLSDLDSDLCALWNSVLVQPFGLKQLIKEFVPTVDSFFTFKQELETGAILDPLQRGFKKLALHQMSYSGLGAKAGGPIGGLSQSSKYAVGCRWSSKHLSDKIDTIRAIFQGVKCVMVCDDLINNCPFTDVIPAMSTAASFTYLDPPYYIKGQELYLHGFDIPEHLALKECVDKLQGSAAISYDSCPEILEMYKAYQIIDLPVNYTINTSRNKTEILVLKG